MSRRLVSLGLYTKCNCYFSILSSSCLNCYNVMNHYLLPLINTFACNISDNERVGLTDELASKKYWMYYVLCAVRKAKHLHIEKCHWSRKHCRCMILQRHKRTSCLFSKEVPSRLLSIAHILPVLFLLASVHINSLPPGLISLAFPDPCQDVYRAPKTMAEKLHRKKASKLANSNMLLQFHTIFVMHVLGDWWQHFH